jgi:hypothetical protein
MLANTFVFSFLGFFWVNFFFWRKNWLNILFQCKMFYSHKFLPLLWNQKNCSNHFFYLANYERRSSRNVSFQCTCVFSNKKICHFCEVKKTIVTIFVNFITIVIYGKTQNFLFFTIIKSSLLWIEKKKKKGSNIFQICEKIKKIVEKISLKLETIFPHTSQFCDITKVAII